MGNTVNKYTAQEVLNNVFDSTTGTLNTSMSGGGTITGNLTITGDLTVEGNLNFGDAGIDIMTVAGYIRGSASGKGFVSIGNASSSHSLSGTSDLVITGKTEFNDASYFDAISNFGATMIIGDAITMAWVTAGAGGNYWNARNGQQMFLGVGTSSNRSFVIGEATTGLGKNYDHTLSTNPRLYIHSAVDPNSDNTQWMSLFHDQTMPRIQSGLGALHIGTGTTGTMVNNAGSLFVTGDAEIGGVYYTIRQCVVAPGAVRNIVAGTGLTTIRRMVTVQGSGGPVTVTATPSINGSPTHGELMTVMGWSSTNTVTFQDNSVLAGSLLELAGGINATLGEFQSITFVYNQTKNKWIEIGRRM